MAAPGVDLGGLNCPHLIKEVYPARAAQLHQHGNLRVPVIHDSSLATIRMRSKKSGEK